MNLLDRAASGFVNQRSAGTSSESKMDWGGSWFGGWGGAKTAKPMTAGRSLQLSAVWNAVDIISNGVGIVPFGVYKEVAEGRERQKGHPIDWLLSQEPDGPDGFLTPFIFKKISSVSVKLRGNALWQIKSKNNGTVYLKYIPWDDVTDIRYVKPADGDKYLTYLIKGGDVLLAHEVLHYKGLTRDGIVGLSTITYAALSLNIAIEIQQFSYTNFDNKGVRQGVISTDKTLKSIDGVDPKPKVREGWRNAMQEKSPDRIVVLDDGFTFTPINFTPQDLQLIESGRFSIEEIARWFNIAPHKIKSLQQSTNNNIEQQSLDFLTDTIQPDITNMEQENTKKLIIRPERLEGYSVKGNMNVLLRSDMKSKAEYYSKMVNSGIYLANEVRAYEEMNSLPGGGELRIPVNTQTQKQIDKSLDNE